MRPQLLPKSRQDNPPAPIGLTVTSQTGKAVPVEVRYSGFRDGRHQWESVEEFPPSQVWRVSWRFVSPDADVHILLREPR